jgi:YD repeat-containing protein
MNRKESRGAARALLLGAGALALAATAALAAETITYSYDARGRLVKAERTGSVNGNSVTNYTYDKADNRATRETKTGQ